MKNINYIVIIFLLIQFACGTKKSIVINENEIVNEKMIKSIKELAIFKPSEIIMQAIKSNRDSVVEEKFQRYRIYSKNKKVLEFIEKNHKGDLEKSINTLDKNGRLIGGKKYNSNGDIIETWKYSYDDNGNTAEINYYDIDGTLSRKMVNAHDDENNWLGYKNYNSKGEVTEHHANIYFENGNLKEKSRYKPDGSLIDRKTNEYDDNGNVIFSKAYKSDGSFMIYKSEYDDMNNKVENYWINEKGEQTRQYSYSYVYDQYGNYITKKRSKDGVLNSMWVRKIEYYD